MSLQIGRITGLPEPRSWQSTGEAVTIAAAIAPTDAASAFNLRDRLLGYSENLDEPTVPIIVDGEPRLSGYYRVHRVSLTTDPTALAKGWFSYQVDADRVPSFRNPLFEDILTATLRSPNSGGGSGRGHIGVPQSALEFLTLGYQFNVFHDRASADGPITVRQVSFGGAGGNFSSAVRWSVPVADYYKGQCFIRAADPIAGTQRDVVGRQLYAPDLTSWTISNGLVRVTPTGTSGYTVQNVDNFGAWGVQYTFVIQWVLTPFNAFDTRTSLSILRNSPEECVLRIGGYSSTAVVGGPLGMLTLDIRLRRGQRTAEFIFSSGQPFRWDFYRSAGPLAMTIFTNHMSANANDASGNRLIMASGEAVTFDNVNAQVYLNGAQTSFQFAIGAEVPGGTATFGEDHGYVTEQYMGVLGERVQVVGR